MINDPAFPPSPHAQPGPEHLQPILWAAEDAPVRDAEERVILTTLVMAGDFDGTNCVRSYGMLAKISRVDERTVIRRCHELKSRGILKEREEHQSPEWLATPKERKPRVWEAMIPAVWWGATYLPAINDRRAALGREPLTSENRPSLPEAPPKSTRADKGTKRPYQTGDGHSKHLDVMCQHARAYELTCDQYDAMKARSQGRCEICDRPDHQTPRGELVIDHFQGGSVFFVRGLLCDRCNAVMARHDGNRPWGPSTLPFVERARAYHLNAFGQPSDEQSRRADEWIQRQRAFSARSPHVPDPLA